jgi:phosphoglycolate phosphatase
MIKALFFDFDGTISNSKKLSINTLKQVLKNHNPRNNPTDQQIKSLIGLKLNQILEKLKIKKLDQGKLKKEFYNQITKHATKLKPCTSLQPLKQLKNLKQQLKQENKTKLKLIVISNANKKFLKASIKQLKIKNLFDKTYALDSQKNKNITKDKIIKQLLKKHKLKPKQTAYIGDRTTDILYAKRANITSIAINNKCAYSTLKEIKKQKPDYIIKNFQELKKILENH